MMLRCFVLFFVIFTASAKCKRCFPNDFLWGAATSSYQTEGSWNTSGKGENIWDWFTHNFPDKILDGSNGDIATDSYNRYEEDVKLLQNLGVDFYRFSISWSRILPEGTLNNVNEEGVEFYLNLLKSLKAKNIEPLVTIYHWDLPIQLHQLGGWANPQIVDFFDDYANLCYERFGEYVKYWITINEPISQCYYGYGSGVHAPGITQSGTLTYQCAQNMLLAHAKAWHSYNDTFKATQNGQAGITLVSLWYEPLNGTSDEDKLAAENAFQWAFGMFGHPIFIGNWPQKMIDRIGNLSVAQGFTRTRLPAFTEDQVTTIKGTYDFLGLNYYTTLYVTPTANLQDIENTTVDYIVDRGVTSSFNPSWPKAQSAWLFDVPVGIRGMLNWVANNYGNTSILITENGWSTENGVINDTERITYIQGHLCNVLKARYVDGVNVIGYTHWTLIDNFEWGSGYTEGFGLVSVDFTSENRTRTPKNSYYYYQQIVKSNCLEHCSLHNN